MQFDNVLSSQRLIQKERMGIDPSSMNLVEVADEIMRQQQYLLDEITEVLTALGGEHGKASWKAWKADHEKVKGKKLEDLTKEEAAELLGECADVFIFVLNILSLCGVTWYDILKATVEKQEVNIQRWENGY